MDNNSRRSLIWLIADFLIAGILLWLDQLSKQVVLKNLKDREPISIIKGVFELDYLENRGSAFGMFQNQKVFLLTVGIVFMLIMIYLVVKTPKNKRFLPMHLAAAGIIAGGIGNMIDRFTLGYVVDFFSFVLIHFPVFNVADVFIVVATFLLAFLLIFIYQDEDLEFLKPSFAKKKEQ